MKIIEDTFERLFDVFITLAAMFMTGSNALTESQIVYTILNSPWPFKRPPLTVE